MTKESQVLVLITYVLVAIGIVMIYSASAVYSDQIYKHSSYFLIRQIIFVAIGSFVFFLSSSLDPDFLRKQSLVIIGISIVMLVAIFMPFLGHTAGGARRWIQLPFFTFQPAEFTKLSMCVYLADYLSRKSKAISTGSLVVFIPPIAILFVLLGLMIVQPDLGSCIFLLLLCGTLFFLSGIRFRYIMIAGVLVAIVLVFLILEAPYRMRRITAYLDPWKDPQGSGFQIIQSFIAFGLGGIRGAGLGESTQKLFYLPQAHTDFIFSIIGEELGLIGTVVIVILYFSYFVVGIRIAQRSRSPFHRLLAYALTLLITLQAIINLLVVLGLIPTKGLPLPFISYGGTALIFHMMAVGVLVAIDRSSILFSGR